MPINATAFTPDSKHFATACGDGTVRLWDALTGQLVSDQFKHPGANANCLAFSPNGRILAVGTTKAAAGQAPEAAYLWDVTSGQRLGPPLTHMGGVRSIEFSSDGKSVLTGCGDGTARLWDAATGLPLTLRYPPELAGRVRDSVILKHSKAVNMARFTPDGQTIVTGSDDGLARLWDLATGSQLVGTSPLRKMPVSDLACSPDGQTLVTVCRWDRDAQSSFRGYLGRSPGLPPRLGKPVPEHPG